MTEQPVYELRPLFDVFKAAGGGWQHDEAVQAELARQGLRVEVHPDTLRLWPTIEGRHGLLVIDGNHIEGRTWSGVDYGYTSEGDFYIGVDDHRQYGKGLKPFVDVLDYLANATRLVERIRDANIETHK